MNQGIAIMQTALWIVGLFTLLSGIVGVSNIMLITVKERTREFGVRKAIGAKPWSILKLIITESIIITSFFGYIGMVCGVAANEIMDATIGHTTVDTGLFKAAMFVNLRWASAPASVLPSPSSSQAPSPDSSQPSSSKNPTDRGAESGVMQNVEC